MQMTLTVLPLSLRQSGSAVLMSMSCIYNAYLQSKQSPEMLVLGMT